MTAPVKHEEVDAACRATMDALREVREADALPGEVLDALESAASALIADLMISRVSKPNEGASHE